MRVCVCLFVPKCKRPATAPMWKRRTKWMCVYWKIGLKTCGANHRRHCHGWFKHEYLHVRRMYDTVEYDLLVSSRWHLNYEIEAIFHLPPTYYTQDYVKLFYYLFGIDRQLTGVRTAIEVRNEIVRFDNGKRGNSTTQFSTGNRCVINKHQPCINALKMKSNSASTDHSERC